MPQPSTSVFVIQYNSLLLAPRLLFGCVQIQQAGQEHLLLVLVDRIQERTLDRRFWLDHGAEIWPGRRWGLCGSNTQNTLGRVAMCDAGARLASLIRRRAAKDGTRELRQSACGEEGQAPRIVTSGNVVCSRPCWAYRAVAPSKYRLALKPSNVVTSPVRAVQCSPCAWGTRATAQSRDLHPTARRDWGAQSRIPAAQHTVPRWRLPCPASSLAGVAVCSLWCLWSSGNRSHRPGPPLPPNNEAVCEMVLVSDGAAAREASNGSCSGCAVGSNLPSCFPRRLSLPGWPCLAACKWHAFLGRCIMDGGDGETAAGATRTGDKDGRQGRAVGPRG